MRRPVRLVLLSLLCLAAMTAGGSLLAKRAPRTSCKPVAPVDLEASLVGDPSAPTGVTVRAVSRTGHEVDVEIVLPDGVAHLAGERKMRGRRCDLRVDFHPTDRNRREILVRATIQDGNGKLTRVLPLVIFDGPRPRTKGRDARDGRGQPILEFSP